MNGFVELEGVRISTAFVTPRFIRLLRLAWRRMPEDARRAIADYWQDPRQQAVLPVPIFILTPRPVDGGAAGVTSMAGFLLRFDSRVVLEWDEERVEDLIARELAHVHNYALDAVDMARFQWSDESLRIGEAARDAMDIYARDMARSWGFEPVHDVV